MRMRRASANACSDASRRGFVIDAARPAPAGEGEGEGKGEGEGAGEGGPAGGRWPLRLCGGDEPAGFICGPESRARCACDAGIASDAPSA